MKLLVEIIISGMCLFFLLSVVIIVTVDMNKSSKWSDIYDTDKNDRDRI